MVKKINVKIKKVKRRIFLVKKLIYKNTNYPIKYNYRAKKVKILSELTTEDLMEVIRSVLKTIVPFEMFEELSTFNIEKPEESQRYVKYRKLIYDEIEKAAEYIENKMKEKGERK